MIRPGEDAPEISSYLFLQAQFTISLAGLMGTLEDPKLAAETTNSLRGMGVITAREAERGVFTSSYSCYSSLRGWVDPQIPLEHKPLIELPEQTVPAATIPFGGLFLTLLPHLWVLVWRSRSSALCQLTWSSAGCCL